MPRNLKLFACLACCLTSCFDSYEKTKVESTALRPQAIVFVDESTLAVSLTRYDGKNYGRGEVVFLDAQTGERKSSFYTTQKNPQHLVLTEDFLFSVASGVIDLSDPEHPKSVGGGAIDRLNRGDETLASLESLNLSDVNDVPMALALAGNRGILTSAIANSVYAISANPLEIIKEPKILTSAPAIGLGSVVAWQEHFFVADFNADRLYFLNASGDSICDFELGKSAHDIEGPESITVLNDRLYIILAMSGQLVRLDLRPFKASVEAGTPDCSALKVERIGDALGMTPNHIVAANDHLYVVDSGRNRVDELDQDGRSQRFFALGVGSNPWHAAVDESGQRLAVTELAKDAISIFRLDSGKLEARYSLENGESLPDETPPSETQPDDKEKFVCKNAKLADIVVSAPGASELRFHDPEMAVNGVRGAGFYAGSMDVYSLESSGEEASIVLSWSGDTAIFDGQGPEFAIFENGFKTSIGWYFEPMVVEVSSDGVDFIAFPHDYLAEDETVYVSEPELWLGFAGLTPVMLHEELNPVSPFSEDAGGDRFDLADLPDSELGKKVKREGVRFIRLTSASACVNRDSGEPFPLEAISMGADVDGVYGCVTE